ncbi:MAG: glutathione S-transferase family protein, partial [Pseudomonadota bacterium]
LPALSRDDGPALYDSRVICRYLNTRANAGLYPDGDWDALVLEATGDGMMDSAVSMIYERRFRPEEIVSEDWIAAQWAKVTGAMTALEAMWMAHLKGPITIGPIAVACALGYLDFRHAERNWQAQYPELAAWYEEFCKRESMQLTIPA